MRIAYFDCFSGAAGDMILAALIDAGWPAERLHWLVNQLGLPGVSATVEKVKRHGIAATHVRVVIGPEAIKKHRHLHHIRDIIDAAAGLPPRMKDNALAVFRRLAEAEAAVHQTTIEKVHFHEVGAADAIVDIVGACLGLADLGVERTFCSPIPTGHGTVTCEHGVMPVPAPATALLLRGVPLAACDEPGELTTPTGAAVLTTLAGGFGPMPPMTLRASGTGAGTREGQTRPNILRVLIGETAAADGDETDTVALIEAQLDDATGQVLAHAGERLLAAGALDAYLTPIIMKKGRPGHLLTVLCRPEDCDALERVVLTETTTFGLRRSTTQRRKLAREHATVQTPHGPIRVKLGRLAGRVVQAWPEYDDCVAAAARTGAPLRQVQQAALEAWSRAAPVETKSNAEPA